MSQKCEDPEGCAHKAERWVRYQDENLWIGEKLLAELRESRFRKETWIRNTDHSEKRKVDRCISEREERLLIDHEAWPFEYQKDKYGTEKLSLVGSLKVGEKLYRPIHIILIRQDDKQWKVATIYDPRSKGFKWGNNHQKRICFCR
jgi:hypothetical protein